jgi:hypothetical protein
MKNFILFVTFWVVTATGAYAQGRLSPDEDNSDPNRSYQAAHQTKTTKDVVSEEGLIAEGPKMAKAELDLNGLATTMSGGEVISLRPKVATRETSQTDITASPDADLEQILLQAYAADRSKEPQFSPSNFRAWDYTADDSDFMAAWSTGGLATAPATTAQNGTAIGVGAGNNVTASAASMPQQQETEIINLGGPQRMVISNIASPEPNTVALGLIGGVAWGWRLMARRRRS